MSKLPPGPSGKIPTTWNVMTRPYAWYHEMRERYGPTFQASAMNGDLVVTGDPPLVRAIFSAAEEDVRPFAVEAAAPVLGEDSVLLTQGERHKRARRIMMPVFSGDRMRAYGRRMREIAIKHARTWPEQDPYVVHDGMLDISLEIIVATIFGARDEREATELTCLTTAVVDRLHPTLLFAKPLQFKAFGVSPWDRFVEAQQAFRAALLGMVHARRDSEAELGDDVLSALLSARDEDGSALSDDELIAHLVALLVAGHETTAIAMSWAIYWLHKTPDALAKLREELAEAGDPLEANYAAAPWLGLVVKETLRLWPIVPDIIRTLEKPMTLGEWTVPAGMAVAAVPAITHYDPELYPEPFAFRPERFATFTPRPWEYFPFGGGIRRCIGASFAGFEMAQVLGAILSTVDIELVSHDEVKPVRRNVTLAPKGGIPIRARLR